MDLVTLSMAKNYTNGQIDGVNTDIGAIESALDGKSNKPESPTEGNIAVLDADGNVADGNSSLSDIASQIDEIVRFSSGIGSPAGVYANISALISANPDHTKIYVTLNDGKWCYWNGDTFVSAAVYQTLASAASDIPTSTAGVSVQNALDNLSNVDSFVYGVRWDKSSSPTLTRIGPMMGATVSVGTDAIPSVVTTATVNGNEVLTYNKYIKDTLFDWPEVTDTYGNVFVKIPKIYLKKIDSVGNKEWYASRVSFDGCYLPKCFYDFTNNRELDYVLVGKYPASLSSDTTKLESKPNTFPLYNKNIVEFRDLAKANNTGGILGYQQLDIHVVDLLQTLFIIQNATLYSQSKCAGFSYGRYIATDVATVTESSVNRIIVANDTAAYYEAGQTIGIGTSLGGNQIMSNRLITSIDVYDGSNKAIMFDGAAVTVTTGNILYNLANKNGFSSNIVSRFGSKSSISTGKHGFVWNGIENLYGNIYQLVDGLNINNNQAWVCNDANSYASNTFASPYEQLSYVCANSNNYIKEMGYDSNHPYAMLPVTVDSNLSTTYYTDYYYQSSGQRIALFGGSWSRGTNDGLFYWDLGNSSWGASVNVGARLLKKPL